MTAKSTAVSDKLPKIRVDVDSGKKYVIVGKKRIWLGKGVTKKTLMKFLMRRRKKMAPRKKSTKKILGEIKQAMHMPGGVKSWASDPASLLANKLAMSLSKDGKVDTDKIVNDVVAKLEKVKPVEKEKWLAEIPKEGLLMPDGKHWTANDFLRAAEKLTKESQKERKAREEAEERELFASSKARAAEEEASVAKDENKENILKLQEKILADEIKKAEDEFVNEALKVVNVRKVRRNETPKEYLMRKAIEYGIIPEGARKSQFTNPWLATRVLSAILDDPDEEMYDDVEKAEKKYNDLKDRLQNLKEHQGENIASPSRIDEASSAAPSTPLPAMELIPGAVAPRNNQEAKVEEEEEVSSPVVHSEEEEEEEEELSYVDEMAKRIALAKLNRERLREQARERAAMENVDFISEARQEEEEQEGDGKRKYRDDGLSTGQINSLMRGYPYYLGCVGCDQILDFDVKPRSRFGFVMNTDPSYKKGQHWVAIYIDARPNGTHSVEYYDSLADLPTRQVFEDLKKLSNSLRAHHPLILKMNKIADQSDDTSNCGYFASKFLIDRFNGKSFAEASGYNRRYPRGERDIEEWKRELGIEKFKTIDEQTGEGFRDVIRSGVDYVKRGYEAVKDRVKDVFGGLRKHASPAVRSWLGRYGDLEILEMKVCRKPIYSVIEKLANLLSNGQWEVNKSRLSYDKLMHLFVLFKVRDANSDKVFRIEKNHVVEIVGDRYDTDSKTQAVPFAIQGGVTMRKLFEDAEKKVGADKLWIYDARTQNCQFFIKWMFSGTRGWNSSVEKFVMQDAEKVLEGMGLLGKIAKVVTDVAGVADVAMQGAGMNLSMTDRRKRLIVPTISEADMRGSGMLNMTDRRKRLIVPTISESDMRGSGNKFSIPDWKKKLIVPTI